MKFGRILAVLALLASFFSFAHACALCALYTPTAHADIKFNLQGETIKTVAVTWTFSENFTALTLQSYDENADKALSKNEEWKVQKSLLDYIVPRGYLTNVGYYDDGGESKTINRKILSQRIFLEDGRLNFEYVLEFNLAALDKRTIVFEIIDREGFFNFKFLPQEPYKLSEKIFAIPNVNLNTAFYELSLKEPSKSENKPELSELIKKENLRKIDETDEKSLKSNALANSTLAFLEKLKELIKADKEKFSAINFIFIMFVSFIYGMLHAAGPGHAKILTASYFAASGGNYAKAFLFATKIGFLHVAGALAIVCSSYFLIDVFAARLASDAATITTKISAAVIVAVASFMLYARIKKAFLKPKFKFLHTSGESRIFVVLKDEKCECGVCENRKPRNSSEWLIVLASALVPCPGTILIFTLAFSLNNYFTGIASGIFTALGMSAVIFAAAILGFNVKNILKFKNLKRYCEIIALLIMLGLGIFMFYISDKLSVL